MVNTHIPKQKTFTTMMKQTCPLCQKSLSLKQINFTTAVYICEDLNCKYPIGFDCIVVERKFEDMDKSLDLTAGNLDLNDWLEEVVNMSDDNNLQKNDNAASTEETTDDPLSWINNMIKDADDSSKEHVPTTQASIPQAPPPPVQNDTEMCLDDMLNFLYSVN